jgi:flap endonuclease-1
MQLTNEAGEVTSHLTGLWYRTIKFIEHGIKPVYVFDGQPLDLKRGELDKRRALKEKAAAELEAAVAADNAEDVERFTKRTVRMEASHKTDCEKLLRLMGVPVVLAPFEAEAQCAALARADKVYAAVSEDMDTLTFGAPRLVRKLFASEKSMDKAPPMEISLDKALAGLGLTMDQFIDVCILSGCDYCDTIKGVASISALKLVKQHGSLEKILENIDREKHAVPDVDWAKVQDAFRNPKVTDPETIDLVWSDPDEAGLLEFLVTEKGFKKERIESGIAKLKKARSGGSQSRLDTFFTRAPAPTDGSASKPLKRKAEESSKKAVGKLTKTKK